MAEKLSKLACLDTQYSTEDAASDSESVTEKETETRGGSPLTAAKDVEIWVLTATS